MNYGKKGSKKRQAELTSKGIMYGKKMRVIFCKVLLVCCFAVAIIGGSLGFGVYKGILDSAPSIDDIDATPTGKSVEDMVYEAQRNVILKIAEKESCVIIGRNADFILKDREDVLNVFIHGDMPEKVQRICKLYNVAEADAAKMITETDKRRRTNYNFYTDQKWGMAKNYTLSLNSSQLGYERCEEIIMECVK